MNLRYKQETSNTKGSIKKNSKGNFVADFTAKKSIMIRINNRKIKSYILYYSDDIVLYSVLSGILNGIHFMINRVYKMHFIGIEKNSLKFKQKIQNQYLEKIQNNPMGIKII
jgi:hypothetical protein